MNSEIVDTFPCAHCTTPTEVTAFTIEVAKTMNRAAFMKGIPPLRKSEAVLCDACYATHRAEREAATRRALLRDVDLWNRYQNEAIPSEVLLEQVSDRDFYRALVNRRETVISRKGKRSGRATDRAVFGGEQ